jgi:hypothetical protein
MLKTTAIITAMILSVAALGAVVGTSERDRRNAGDWERSRLEDESHDRDDRQGPHDRDHRPALRLSTSRWLESREDVAPISNPAYVAECGSCHFAYQPGLLPASAWARVMGSLQEHYGDDASLEDTQVDALRSYLVANAADRSSQSRSQAFGRGDQVGDALPRITDTRYFRHEHDEIPRRFVEGNKDVRSFSNCLACHRTAERGVYNEHQVLIPGVGRWDD